jgi:hypothetical protein
MSRSETTTRVVIAAFLLLTAWLVGGCVQSVNEPTRATRPTTTVTVSTLTRTTHAPIADALVMVNGPCEGATDSAGALVVTVPLGVETTIAVSHAGYRSFSVAATVNGAGEHWTFYLEVL